MPHDTRPDAYDAVHSTLTDVRARMVALLASHPDWAMMQHAAQAAATESEADTAYRRKLEDIFANVPAYHALVRLDEALALLPGLSATSSGTSSSTKFAVPTLDVIAEVAAEASGPLSTRLPTLQLVRTRGDENPRPDRSTALQVYEPSARSVVSSFASVSLADVIKQIRRGAASQRPKPLTLLFPDNGFTAGDVEPLPPKAAAVAVPAPGFTNANIATPKAEKPIDGGAKPVIAVKSLSHKLPVAVEREPDMAAVLSAVAVPEPAPLHEVATHRLDELEAEIRILTTKPAKQTMAPVPAARSVKSAEATSKEILTRSAHVSTQAQDVDEAEIEIVKRPVKPSITLEPLPELPLTPYKMADGSRRDDAFTDSTRKPSQDTTVVRIGTDYAYDLAEEASVVIVRKSADTPSGKLAFLPEQKATGAVSRFLKALNGN